MRCPWAEQSELEQVYHDQEWGKPLKEDRKLFEFLILEGAQAGLSWRTVLQKRTEYRKAFQNFDPHEIAKYTSKDVERLMQNAGIIRNRLKIESTISNAQAYLRVTSQGRSFSDYIWQFVSHTPIKNRWKTMKEVPTTTDIAKKMSKALKKDGFRFVGPTICYAFMQATGMVNDHLISCHRFSEED